MPDDVIQAAMLMSGSDTVTVLPGGITGINGSVQFNDAGNFGGDSLFTFNALSKSLTVPAISGSLTQLANGDAYLVSSGSLINITTASNGSVVISDSFETVPVIVYDEAYTSGESKFLSATGPLTITTASNSLIIDIRREKLVHEIAAFYPAFSTVTIPGAQFNYANFDNKRIDIFVNGQLLTSGSSKDYELLGNEEDIRLSFDLIENDVIVAIIQ
jgi:archaellum component FlaF (FlaF/FlaG flagellin family)